jgi:hypothetical protein
VIFLVVVRVVCLVESVRRPFYALSGLVLLAIPVWIDGFTTIYGISRWGLSETVAVLALAAYFLIAKSPPARTLCEVVVVHFFGWMWFGLADLWSVCGLLILSETCGAMLLWVFLMRRPEINLIESDKSRVEQSNAPKSAVG